VRGGEGDAGGPHARHNSCQAGTLSSHGPQPRGESQPHRRAGGGQAQPRGGGACLRQTRRGAWRGGGRRRAACKAPRLPCGTPNAVTKHSHGPQSTRDSQASWEEPSRRGQGGVLGAAGEMCRRGGRGAGAGAGTHAPGSEPCGARPPMVQFSPPGANTWRLARGQRTPGLGVCREEGASGRGGDARARPAAAAPATKKRIQPGDQRPAAASAHGKNDAGTTRAHEPAAAPGKGEGARGGERRLHPRWHEASTCRPQTANKLLPPLAAPRHTPAARRQSPPPADRSPPPAVAQGRPAAYLHLLGSRVPPAGGDARRRPLAAPRAHTTRPPTAANSIPRGGLTHDPGAADVPRRAPAGGARTHHATTH
jgi:hypothetical protein